VPLSRPALATMTLFALVYLWNDWFFPSLYLRDSRLYPLQTYLQLFLNQANITELFRQGNIDAFLALVSNRGLRAATLVIAMVPILLCYPLLQRYFVKGIVLGAVKE
jgi:putative aldouronate transport system permease protein